MSTPVHDDDDVSGVTSSGVSLGTPEVRGLSASTEPVPPMAGNFAGAENPAADQPAEADRTYGPVGADKSGAAEELASRLLATEAAFVADLKARVNRPMPRPRSMQAPAMASQAAPEGERRWDPNAPSQPSDPQSPPVAPDIREETDAPPTAPEAAAVRRPLIQASTAVPNSISSMRLPQGLGGPNIAAPSALELLRARNAIPPGTEGLPGSRLPVLSRSLHFEGDVAKTYV